MFFQLIYPLKIILQADLNIVVLPDVIDNILHIIAGQEPGIDAPFPVVIDAAGSFDKASVAGGIIEILHIAEQNFTAINIVERQSRAQHQGIFVHRLSIPSSGPLLVGTTYGVEDFLQC